MGKKRVKQEQQEQKPEVGMSEVCLRKQEQEARVPGTEGVRWRVAGDGSQTGREQTLWALLARLSVWSRFQVDGKPPEELGEDMIPSIYIIKRSLNFM